MLNVFQLKTFCVYFFLLLFFCNLRRNFYIFRLLYAPYYCSVSLYEFFYGLINHSNASVNKVDSNINQLYTTMKNKATIIDFISMFIQECLTS